MEIKPSYEEHLVIIANIQFERPFGLTDIWFNGHLL